ncbi:MAG: hypothetical protein ABWX96_05910 [Propionibacteriaceae bacterium]
MSRPVTVLVATVSLVLSALLVVVAGSQASVHYLLPSPTGATRHSALFGPGVVATVVAVLVALLAAGWLVLALVGRTATWMLATVLGLLLVDVLAIAVVAGLDRPSF